MTLLEKSDVVGGQATSIPLDAARYGASWVNNGVQGGSNIFKHTFRYLERHGHPPRDVALQVSFGKGEAGFWTNCFPSRLVARHRRDIRRFGALLLVVKWAMPLLGLVPIGVMLRVLCYPFFSRDFGDRMVYPLIALFLGTGNQTARVPCAIVERLFDDPNMKLWDYDPETLLPNLPAMVTFDNLHTFYRAWRRDLEARGVEVRTGAEVDRVLSRSDDAVHLRMRDCGDGDSDHCNTATTDESFDRMVLCVLADDALRILGPSATRRERFVLGGAAFYDDLTVTHSDRRYFEDHYETRFRPELCAEPRSDEQKRQISLAKGEDYGHDGCGYDDDDSGSGSGSGSDRGSGNRNGNRNGNGNGGGRGERGGYGGGGGGSSGYNPMYYTYTYESDPRCIEMSFNCSNYQHQLKDANAKKNGSGSGDGGYDPVYQTIFLNKQQRHLWTVGDIDEAKIIKTNWWHQLGHRWQHYLRVVPGMMFLHGRNATYFAGSWTLIVSPFPFCPL